VVADEFRDGNVPAKQAPLTCAQAAFAALPASVQERYFRGDSACHEAELLGWLRHPERAREAGGAIGFAVSAVMSAALARAVAQVSEKAWQTFGTEADGTLRQWAEVDFVPGEATEQKDLQPLRYVGLRLLKPQGVLFADGSDRHHHAVVTNLRWDGARRLQWHREKAGTVEHVHDEVKNGLGGRASAQPAFSGQRGVVQAGADGLQRGECDPGAGVGAGGAERAAEEVPAAGGEPGGADEPVSVRLAAAVLRVGRGDRAGAADLGSLRIADAGDGVPVAGGRERDTPRPEARYGHGSRGTVSLGGGNGPGFGGGARVWQCPRPAKPPQPRRVTPFS